MDEFVELAREQARIGFEAGNVPVGAVVVKDSKLIGAGRNRQHETGDPTTHAEMEAIRDAAARHPDQDIEALLAEAVCVTTMMPCQMCAGAIIRFKFARVVVAECVTYVDAGTQPLMERQGMSVEVLQDRACIDLVESYFARYPEQAATMKSPDRVKLKL